MQTIYDFSIPPLLTLLYLPFILVMLIFSTYESVFIKLKFFLKESNLYRFAKFYSLFKFNFKINLLERWGSTIAIQDKTSKESIKNSIKQIFLMVSVEKDPPEVPLREGWSPYVAKQFLLSEGFKTGYYQPSIPEEWSAYSQFVELDNNIVKNTISYYVFGNESTAKTLELILNVYSNDSAIIAHSKLLSSVKVLLKAALDSDVSNDMEEAIMNGNSQVFKLGSFMATIEKNDWSQNHSGSYDIKFVLSKILQATEL
jgi:hypothetical protein